MGYAIQVEPASSSPPVLPETVDRDTARAAHIAAAERAKPLFEQAAVEMEGNVEGGYVMTFYFEMLEGFRNGSGWNWAPDLVSTTSE